MDRYNIFQALWMSFYSKKLYRDVALNWGGKSFIYLFLLLFLSWGYATYYTHRGLNAFYEVGERFMLPQIPVVEIKNGEVNTPEQKPYLITTPDKKENILVIDATGQYQSLNDVKTNVLITKNQVHITSERTQPRTFSIPSAVNGIVNPILISGYIKNLLWFSWAPLLVFFVFGSFMFRVIQTVIYALIGKFFAVLIGARINYMQIVQIGLVSITPVIIIRSIVSGFGLSLPGESFFFLGLGLLYLFYGIVANTDKV